MNRAELIKRIHDEHSDLSRKQVEAIVRGVFDGIADSLASGEEKVSIYGFGSFSAYRVGPRKMHSPLQESGVINAGSTAKLRFVPSDNLKEKIVKAKKAPTKKALDKKRKGK